MSDIETQGETLLEVRDLSAAYSDLKVFEGVNLTVHAGELLAVLGSNGAGKTTLLSTIAGLLTPPAGSVTLLGADITSVPPHRRAMSGLTMVQEGKRVFRGLTVQQNLQIGGAKLPRAERQAAMDRVYELFPILKTKHAHRAGSMSGGQQQMLAIGQALMPNPKVLMLDEPSAGLAPIIVSEVLEVLAVLKTDGVGIILVEQLVGKALSVADRVLVLQQGRVVIDQPAATVTEAELLSAYLGGEKKVGELQ